MSRIIIFLFSVFLSACSAFMVEDVPKIPAETLLIFEVDSLHAELIVETQGQVERGLFERLDKARFKVVQLETEQYEAIRSAAMEVSGAIYEPGKEKFIPLNKNEYIAAVLSMLANNSEHDLVIFPELVIRDAVIDGKQVSWDGVTKPLELITVDNGQVPMPQIARGLSLKLIVYSRNGSKLYQSFTGISLPYRIDYSDGQAEFVLKENFYTEDELNKAIYLATKAMLDRIEYESK